MKSIVYSRLTVATKKNPNPTLLQTRLTQPYINGLTEQEVCPFWEVNIIFFSLFCFTHITMSDIQSKITRHIEKAKKKKK